MPHLTLLKRFYCLLIFIGAGTLAHAENCNITLGGKSDPNSRPIFEVESKPFFTQNEYIQMLEIFDRGANSKKFNLAPSNAGNAILFGNPVYFEISTKFGRQGFADWKLNPTSWDLRPGMTADDDLLFKKLAQRSLSLIRKNDQAVYSQLKQQMFRIKFFGVRYQAKRGQKLAGVTWHNHGPEVLYQGLIILQKPEDLIGGSFLLSAGDNIPIQRLLPDGNGSETRFSSQLDGGSIFRFNVPENHLLIFSSPNTLHATEDFELPIDRAENEGMRDIIGFEIVNK